MRILRSILTVVFFVAGVFVAAANVHHVELIYLPAIELLGLQTALSVNVPLFLIVLLAIVLGVLLGGFAAIFEQARLRLGLRRARKDADRAMAEEARAAALLDNATAEGAGLQAEIDELREELRAAGETKTVDEPLSAFLDEAENEITTDSESASEVPSDPENKP